MILKFHILDIALLYKVGNYMSNSSKFTLAGINKLNGI